MKGTIKKRASSKSNLYLIASVFVVFVVIFAVVFGSGAYEKSKNISSDDGFFDASDIDFDNGENVYLSGEWEFYYNQLIVSDEAEAHNISTFLSVPSQWASPFDFDGNDYDSGGYASYRCVVKNVGAGQGLTVYVPNIACAYNVYVNGVLVSTSGTFSKTAGDVASETGHESVPFLLGENAECEIVIEVAAQNYSGLYMPVLMANYESDAGHVNTLMALNFSLCGIVIFCGILFIIFRHVINKALYSIWLPVLSFILFLRMIMTSEAFAVTQPVFAGVSYETMTVFIFASTFIIKLVALMYLIKCIGIKVEENSIVAFCAAFLVVAVLINFLPNSVFDVYYFAILQLFSFVIDIYIFNKLCIEIANGAENSFLYLLSYMFIVVGVFVDALYTNGLIAARFSWFMPVCFFIFVVFTAIIHALRIRKMYLLAAESQRLEGEVERMNTSIMLSQIQPHFLYNALNTIKSLIKRNPQQAENAIIDFSLYLRGNMDSLTKTAPILFSEELDHVKYYCNIEKLRFGDKLDIYYEIDCDGFYVPTLSVQPIVENAIKHGVTKKPEGGSVTVSAYEDDKNYYICVEDDGVGFDPEEVASRDDDSRSHVGLKNISERFKIIMGGSVEIKSKKGVGTTVTVRLPKEKNLKPVREGLENKTDNDILKEMDI